MHRSIGASDFPIANRARRAAEGLQFGQRFTAMASFGGFGGGFGAAAQKPAASFGFTQGACDTRDGCVVLCAVWSPWDGVGMNGSSKLLCPVSVTTLVVFLCIHPDHDSLRMTAAGVGGDSCGSVDCCSVAVAHHTLMRE